MTAWGILETANDLPTAPKELSIFTTEGYYRGDACRLRRFTVRVDGFVSANAPLKGGELITRPFTFEGDALSLNVGTSAAGSVRVEIQDGDGKALKGYSLRDCDEIYGDHLGPHGHLEGHRRRPRTGQQASPPALRPQRRRPVQPAVHAPARLREEAIRCPNTWDADLLRRRNAGANGRTSGTRSITRPDTKQPCSHTRPALGGYLVLQPGTVIWDEEDGCFKMWYNTQPSWDRPDAGKNLCYATSSDVPTGTSRN